MSRVKLPKLYTTWAFRGYDPVVSYHCTGNYFGALKPEDIATLEHALAVEFLNDPVKPFYAAFNMPALFGPTRNVPVLMTTDSHHFRPYLWQELKGLIPGQSYPLYQPHVSLLKGDTSRLLTFEVVDYVLVANKQIIWSAAESVGL